MTLARNSFADIRSVKAFIGTTSRFLKNLIGVLSLSNYGRLHDFRDTNSI